MRELDGMRIIGPTDGVFEESPRSTWRELVSASETGSRWRLGQVTARPDEGVATHLHPGEPEALIILEGEVELHGAQGRASTWARRRDLRFARHGTRPADTGRRAGAGHLAHPRACTGQEV
jgi:hypothetical protein